jgi:Ni2+-binding GTPase involved in maturation of urease and hydrogenase
MAIPITVFTGFLGAGKTSIILSLLPQLPKDYKVVLLKNEFGDIEGSHQTFHITNVTTPRSGQQTCAAVEPGGCKRNPERMYVSCENVVHAM